MTEIATLLQDLVRIPSINPMGRDLEESLIYEFRVTDYLESFFHALGVPTTRQTIQERRENLLAFHKTDSPLTLLWEVHQDTVPVDQMIIDPFGGRIEDGKLYGRGACDIKGGMSSMLSAFARLVREKPKGCANVILACTVDEEHTFLGVQKLAKSLSSEIRADMAVIAEPTQLNIVHAHKGTTRWAITSRGRACHSSQPDQGINAIYHMGRILAQLETFADELMQRPGDPLLGPATLSVGRINGGVSVNTVPDQCVIEVDRRLIPGENATEAQSEVNSYLRSGLSSDITFEQSDLWLVCPPLAPTGSEELKQRLGHAIDSVVGRHAIEAVPYGTDASTLAESGLPSVVFGPGSIEQAHTRDEFVDLSQVEQASEILFHFATEA